MVTVSQVKSVLNVTNKDTQIEALIPIVESHIKAYCNIQEVPSEYDLNAIRMIEYHLNSKAGVQSESLSRHSVSYADDYPKDVLKGLRRKLRW